MNLDWRVITGGLVGVALILVAGSVGANLVFATRGASPYVAELFPVGDAHSLMMDVSKRTILVNRAGLICSEPAPDAIGAVAAQMAADLSAARPAAGTGQGPGGGSAAASLQTALATDVVKLFERSQGIQALRDGMYRLCEAFVNGAIEKAVYEAQMSDLTSTLNFIVPIELCSKLNRELVLAVVGAGRAAPRPAGVEVKAEGAASESGGVAGLGQSEILHSNFLKLCLQNAFEFGITLAKTAQVRTADRVKLEHEREREVRQFEVFLQQLRTPAPGP